MAKCESCGSSLPANETTCAYCGTRNQVDLKALGGWTVTDPASDRQCPNCAIPLETVKLEGEQALHVEKCSDCGGLFFDPGELPHLLETSVENVYEMNRAFLEGRKKAGPDRRRERFYIPCPVCKTLMTSLSYGERSGVIVDWCKPHGIWLDGGELRSLLEWTKAGGLHTDKGSPFHMRKPEETSSDDDGELKVYFDESTQTYPWNRKYQTREYDLLGDLVGGLFRFLGK